MVDFSKIGKSNRSRGASYERKVARMATALIKKEFKRSPQSGALIREGSLDGAFLSGDLVCSEYFDYSIECKNCSDIRLESLIKSASTSPLTKYWCQCIYDSTIASKKPLLIFNLKSVREDFAVITEEESKNYKSVNKMLVSGIGDVIIDIDNKKVNMLNVPNMAIYLAKDLLREIGEQKWGVVEEGKTITTTGAATMVESKS